MRTAMKTDIPVFWSTDAADSGKKGSGKAESSFLDTFKKAVTENRKPENGQPESRKTDSRKPENREDVSPSGSGREPRPEDATDAADKKAEDISAEAEEEGSRTEELEEPGKDKGQVSDQIAAMLLSAQAAMPPAEVGGIQDGAEKAVLTDVPAVDGLQAVQAAGQTGAEGTLITDQIQLMQDRDPGAKEADGEAVRMAVGAKDGGAAFETLRRAEDGKQENSFVHRMADPKADAEIRTTDGPSGSGQEAGFSDLLKDRSEFLRSMGQAGREASDETGKEAGDRALAGLEDLRRNAQANGVDVAGRFAVSNPGGRFHVAAGTGETAGSTPVFEQLQAGLEQALKTRQQELTLHLKPDGLGDIIIRLASSEGRVTVNIGVSNSDTQKLITSQMMSLKEMLEPLHAEVGEVYHDSQAAMNFLQYGQQMQGQENRHRADAGAFGRQQKASAQEDDEILAVAQQMMAESGLGRLYAYI